MKKNAKNFGDLEIMPTFATANGKQTPSKKKEALEKATKSTKILPCGVMVARRILVPPVRVRILPRQQSKIAISSVIVGCDFCL